MAGMEVAIIFLFYGFFFIATFGGIGVAIWALVDLLNKPEWAWNYAGENRTGYIVFLALGCFMCQFLAWIPALMYFKGAKPKIMTVLQTVPAPVAPLPYGGYGVPGGYGAAPYPGQPMPGQWSAPPPPGGAYPAQAPQPGGYPSPGAGVPQPQSDPTSGNPWGSSGPTAPPSV